MGCPCKNKKQVEYKNAEPVEEKEKENNKENEN